jgi:hypothetical protein
MKWIKVPKFRECELISNDLGYSILEGPCEQGNVLSDPMKRGAIIG